MNKYPSSNHVEYDGSTLLWKKISGTSPPPIYWFNTFCHDDDVPVKNLNLSIGDSVDAWGNKIVYSVYDNVTEKYVFVDETWWNGYTYRAFNVFKSPNRADMTSLVEDTVSKLKIYVPKVK